MIRIWKRVRIYIHICSRRHGFRYFEQLFARCGQFLNFFLFLEKKCLSICIYAGSPFINSFWKCGVLPCTRLYWVKTKCWIFFKRAQPTVYIFVYFEENKKWFLSKLQLQPKYIREQLEKWIYFLSRILSSTLHFWSIFWISRSMLWKLLFIK